MKMRVAKACRLGSFSELGNGFEIAAAYFEMCQRFLLKLYLAMFLFAGGMAALHDADQGFELEHFLGSWRSV